MNSAEDDIKVAEDLIREGGNLDAIEGLRERYYFEAQVHATLAVAKALLASAGTPVGEVIEDARTLPHLPCPGVAVHKPHPWTKLGNPDSLIPDHQNKTYWCDGIGRTTQSSYQRLGLQPGDEAIVEGLIGPADPIS